MYAATSRAARASKRHALASPTSSILSLCLAALVLPSPTRAQASFNEILSDKSQVIVGGTLQVRAVVRDASGIPTPSQSVTWSVNNAAATIAQSGLITTKGLATIRVTARSGAASGEAAF